MGGSAESRGARSLAGVAGPRNTALLGKPLFQTHHACRVASSSAPVFNYGGTPAGRGARCHACAPPLHVRRSAAPACCCRHSSAALRFETQRRTHRRERRRCRSADLGIADSPTGPSEEAGRTEAAATPPAVACRFVTSCRAHWGRGGPTRFMRPWLCKPLERPGFCMHGSADALQALHPGWHRRANSI